MPLAEIALCPFDLAEIPDLRRDAIAGPLATPSLRPRCQQLSSDCRKASHIF